MAESGGTSEYLAVFLDEADEQVETLDQGLLRLEKEPANQDLVQEIFRAAHSLKSSSAAMGFATMSRLTHAAENILDQVRSGETRPNTDLINHLLAAVDALKLMKESIREGGGDDLDIASVLAALSAAMEVDPPTAKPLGDREEDARPFLEAAEDAAAAHAREVTIRLSDDCEMPAVRAHMVLSVLERAGPILRSIPSLPDIIDGRAGRQLRVVIGTQAEDPAIRKLLDSIPEIDSITIGEDPRVADVGAAGRGKSPAELASMAKRADQTVRVSVARLDSLMNLVGELVIDRTRVAQLGFDLEARHGGSDMVQSLRETSAHMGRIVGELQEEVMKARMLPIARLFQRFPRMVRDLAQKLGKDVDLALEGEETELDRTVIEEMVDPLNHLLRNALDHGIESPQERQRTGKPARGRITLSARQLENHIVVEVIDDGAGIDVEALKAGAVEKGTITAAAAPSLSREDALQLIFSPGFSTAGSVSDVSGRGVGMDVVKSNVNRLHGSVRVRTELGAGTTIAVSLPLTLAISQALLVTAGSTTAAVPLVYVVETTRLPIEDIHSVRGRVVMRFRDRVLPLVALSEALGREGSSVETDDLIRIVVARSGDQEIGLIVDRLVGEQEIVLKPLGAGLGETIGVSGATILGNGTVALVLDVASLIDRSALHAADARSLRRTPAAITDTTPIGEASDGSSVNA